MENLEEMIISLDKDQLELLKEKVEELENYIKEVSKRN